MSPRPESAKAFHALHHGAEILTLANAWDAGSARVIESVGAKAVATTSAGFAWSLGYPDGDALPLEELAHGVKLITRAIQIPLTVDMESGFGRDAAAVGESVARVIGAGAVGLNIEDGANPPELLAAKIEAIRKVAAREGVDIFVNARIDVHLFKLAPEPERVAESLRRARIYQDAGANGIFVPAIVAPDDIKAVVAGIDRPLNVLAWPGLPPAAELAKLGVKRLSAGSGIAKAVWGRTAALAKSFLQDGAYEALAEGAMDSATANGLYKK
ncbi:isocitrate lyase/phosphoenolpyruvate mutase family protein [Dongia sp.]|uniref:isocitrate lyase/phosphoenolpyruvate mutase family protein n=1 Tax=Dongia sp. TaxID=1977262 RepID=UPI0034A44F80